MAAGAQVQPRLTFSGEDPSALQLCLGSRSQERDVEACAATTYLPLSAAEFSPGAPAAANREKTAQPDPLGSGPPGNPPWPLEEEEGAAGEGQPHWGSLFQGLPLSVCLSFAAAVFGLPLPGPARLQDAPSSQEEKGARARPSPGPARGRAGAAGGERSARAQRSRAQQGRASQWGPEGREPPAPSRPLPKAPPLELGPRRGHRGGGGRRRGIKGESRPPLRQCGQRLWKPSQKKPTSQGCCCARKGRLDFRLPEKSRSPPPRKMRLPLLLLLALLALMATAARAEESQETLRSRLQGLVQKAQEHIATIQASNVYQQARGLAQVGLERARSAIEQVKARVSTLLERSSA
ncbi:apolipoprotein C-III [Erythrolamprus reginae]|uniref:apolipoprotein C-III n=1 Tax=Erythrolamprus reginae TaxID=121349 RepID=UPI00396CCEF6